MCIDEQITQITQNTYIYPWKSYDDLSTGVNPIMLFQEKYLTCRYKDFDDNFMNKQIIKFANGENVFSVILIGSMWFDMIGILDVSMQKNHSSQENETISERIC